MSTDTLRIVVPTDVRSFILDWARDSRGSGGFQSLYRLLADRLRAGRVLRLSPDELERITRYATEYGDGGHQQTLRKLIAAWVAQHTDTLLTK